MCFGFLACPVFFFFFCVHVKSSNVTEAAGDAPRAEADRGANKEAAIGFASRPAGPFNGFLRALLENSIDSPAGGGFQFLVVVLF